jgi:hypothetical protein
LKGSISRGWKVSRLDGAIQLSVLPILTVKSLIDGALEHAVNTNAINTDSKNLFIFKYFIISPNY